MRRLLAWKTMDGYILASEDQYKKNEFKRADTEIRRAELEAVVKSISQFQ